MASRTGHVELHPPASLLDRALALALRTNAGCFNVAVAMAVCADILTRDVQAHHAAANCCPERDADLIFQVRPRLRTFLSCGAAAAAEHAGKDVAKPATTTGASLSARAF